jgi:PAS domain S-box-containing protein
LKNSTGINIIPPNDTARVAALHQYRILDSPPESVFDSIVALACQMLDTPAGLISLVDKDRVFFKANYKDGFTYSEREKNICSFVVLEEDLVVIENATNDVRVQHNPAVTGSAHIRFYAGAPLKTRDGFTLGTLCVVDLQPRTFDAKSRALLKSMADMVMEQMVCRLDDIEKDEKRGIVQRLNEQLRTANTQLTKTISQLAKANAKLEQAQQTQSTLLEQLRISETRLLQAMESGNMGTWNVDIENEKVLLSDRSKEIFGLADKDEFLIGEVLQAIQPAFRQQVSTAWQQAFTNAQEVDISFPVSHLINGQRRWVRSTGKMFSNSYTGQASYSGMLMDITEQKQDEQRKNDFIGMVSHELKTPLTSISGYIELLQMNDATTADPFTITVLEKSFIQVKKMVAMINGFLNLSRLESAKIEINKTHFLLNELVKELIEETSIVQSRHTILFDASDVVMAHADRDKIGNVITNLINNAIKYSAIGTTITIACKKENRNLQVSVKDEGIGIGAEHLKRLFERYYRVKDDSGISGFGIGLYLSAEIIQSHGGYIWVDSELGKGSTFWFSLPVE